MLIVPNVAKSRDGEWIWLAHFFHHEFVVLIPNHLLLSSLWSHKWLDMAFFSHMQ